MKILVTGGAGFIGSHLTDRLIEQGNKVLVIDNLSTGKKENLNPRAVFFESDIRDFDKISPLFQDVDFVFHLAALPRVAASIEQPIETNDINIKGTLDVLIAARDAKVKKFIYVSSTSVYGDQKNMPIKETALLDPLSPYALQKYVGEMYCKIFFQLFGIQTICLRYFNVFGPRQDVDSPYSGVVAKFLKQKAEHQHLTIVGNGNQKRDFTYVKDIVDATILAAEKQGAVNQIFNIASGRNYSINELAKIIGGETTSLPERPGEIMDSLADISKAKQLLDWEPKYNLETGLKEMMK
ncbi:SDR family oxidoreductase [Candidatus Parcubacteria bacterium]|nr:SDR family oxidoreductase [Candidatus Parcubacteria bacterium]